VDLHRRQFRRLADDLERREETRYVDRSILWERPNGSPLYLAGGRWDRLTKQYVGPAEHLVKLRLQASQEESAELLAYWLQERKAGRPRDYFGVVLYGDRGGGKTKLGVWFVLTALIDLPYLDGTPSIGWQVSVGDRDRAECDRYIREVLPEQWYRYVEWPHKRFDFDFGAEGSLDGKSTKTSLTNYSVDGGGAAGAEALRKGRVDFLFVNEAGRMGKKVPFVGMARLKDAGGLGLFAANPAEGKGRWIYDLHEKAQAREEKTGQPYPVRFVRLMSGGNESLHRDTAGQIEEVLGDIDPAAARFDLGGELIRGGQLAYWNWSARNKAPQPDIGPDITPALIRARGQRSAQYLVGCDFQGTPHMAASVWKVYGSLKDPILWCVGDVIVDQGGEEDLIDALEDAGYTPENCLAIGDASGQWQDGKHSKNSRDSFKVFKDRRWVIVPPRKPRDAAHRPKNPPVPDRLRLVNHLLGDSKKVPTPEPRLLVDPRAERMATALKECETRQGRYSVIPAGYYAHLSDTAGYVAWWVFPQTSGSRRADVPVGLVGEGIKGILG